MTAVALRPSTAADLEWLVELRAVVLRDDLERLGRYDPVRVRERMRNVFDAQNTRVVIVDGVDVGCVSVRPEVDVRWLEHFYLAPHLQGRGIGGRVLRDILADPDPRPLRLNVLQGSAAQRLYERHSFVEDTSDDVDVYMTYRPA
ncbi:GNAT family N-acetyltransferase [Microbacterium sp. cx-55]|uniref:GNAT family N-acetyltransferase n=1 Tax=Microbacterium sp. cx-55 TaxID=2875948 RepID=UPI001CBE1A67|nr:GNAT family N-acetyltransferase [Microbacterium sp. cx-55]MBZ4486535.1 GNAT family N-acetyltransferase [Microbacterium sp. cx-55]UGB36497.1 GNAT family N-acetyltransferase [Microbacterium sp. cx-55]